MTVTMVSRRSPGSEPTGGDGAGAPHRDARAMPSRHPEPIRRCRTSRTRRDAGVRPSPLRLTARGRRLVAGLVLSAAVGLAAVLVPGLDGGAGSPELHLAGDTTVVVRPGDSVWSIALSVAGDRDVRGVVDAIQQLNDLDGGHLQPGDVLRLP